MGNSLKQWIAKKWRRSTKDIVLVSTKDGLSIVDLTTMACIQIPVDQKDLFNETRLGKTLKDTLDYHKIKAKDVILVLDNIPLVIQMVTLSEVSPKKAEKEISRLMGRYAMFSGEPPYVAYRATGKDGCFLRQVSKKKRCCFGNVSWIGLPLG